MTNLKPRRVDLDDIERQLQGISHDPHPVQHDPLAELARIVGQDDPFRAVLAEDRAQPGREPSFAVDDHPVSASPGQRAPYDLRRAANLDLTSYDRNRGDLDAGYGSAEDVPSAGYADARGGRRSSGPRRSKKGLVTVGGVLGLAAIGVGGALTFRDSPNVGRTAGGPPVIQADKAPLKIQPQNPGGMDIPDQNKQIYERGAPEKQTRVVNREEQPVDVQQAARAIAAVPAAPAGPIGSSGASIVPPTTATPGSGASPAPTGSLAASLGEPKRVRTVAIRPDGTVMSDASPARPKSTTSGSAPASAAAPPTPVARPRPAEATPMRPMPTETGSTQRSEPPAPEPKAQTRVAALATPAVAPAEPAAAGSGGFAVQLGIRASEEEARTVFKELQKKYPGELAGKAPLIRKAEVNDKTVYRVRVGPMSKDDAGALCKRLKGVGGQCYVANN